VKKILATLCVLGLAVFVMPKTALAAGISVSGGGTKYVGDNATVTITASGTTFNAFSGSIAVSGAAKIVSCSPGDALWVQKPTGAGSFAGALTNATSSFRIATCTVKGSTTGTGKLTVSGVKLANTGAIVGSDGGSASFTFERKPTPPGTITVTSTSHPDPNTAYEDTTIVLSWDKPTGVTGFAYLIDDQAETTPPSTTTSAETTISYTDKAIGTHYFHIKAINGDGWGPVTHFKIQIKEPDPKIKEDLAKPTVAEIKKAGSYAQNPIEGTISGLVISGTTLPNYMANIKLEPLPKIPDNKIMSAKADESGHFEFVLDFPITAGFYKLTIQGQDNKTLTPLSDPVPFELSLAKGGTITMLTEADTNPPVIPTPKWYERLNWMNVAIVLIILLLASVIANFIQMRRKGFRIQDSGFSKSHSNKKTGFGIRPDTEDKK
jgi:hypothetical protein